MGIITVLTDHKSIKAHKSIYKHPTVLYHYVRRYWE